MNLRQAVVAKCFDCNYDPLDAGSKHQQVESCTCTSCPLYEHRPLTGDTKQRLKDERYNAMTPKEQRIYDKKSELAREWLGKSR